MDEGSRWTGGVREWVETTRTGTVVRGRNLSHHPLTRKSFDSRGLDFRYAPSQGLGVDRLSFGVVGGTERERLRNAEMSGEKSLSPGPGRGRFLVLVEQS